ncbi:MAG: ribosome biogenesis GTPase Der [Acidobacteriia bacterium]|nr:ribosome biogenesis GTPase Der [Terriglobia bacterium]
MPHSSQSATRLATLAIVGRPNVGKSTLFNKLIGRRRAIVTDEPGITRDRLYGEADWSGRRLRVIDTGGIVPEDKDEMPAEIFRQARVALDEADAVVLVVDGRSELTAPDIDLARLLIRSGKPLFLAVNKIDTPKLEAGAENFRQLGIRNLYPVSAEHGLGVAELLDAVMDVLPKTNGTGATEETITVEVPHDTHETALEHPSREIAGLPGTPIEGEGTETEAEGGRSEDARTQRETRVAIIGRPNVGKSTLLNALTATDRAIVSSTPGTTRDAVDEIVERGGRSYRFIDTAGIRRKGKTKLVAEKLSVVMARKNLEQADIALLVVDAAEGATALDANIAGYAHESGRSVIIVVNKWDLIAKKKEDEQVRRATTRHRGGVAYRRGSMNARLAARAGSGNGHKPADRHVYEEELRQGLKFLDYAPVVFVSAKAGKNVDKIFELVTQVAAERRKRIPTAAMNRFVHSVDFDRASVPYSRRVKILYMTQAGTSPPTFVLFTDRAVKLHFSYERFLENQIRRVFGFVGSPIRIKTRARS